MQTVYAEFGQLIVSIGSEWFNHTLPGALQSAIQYDYFLFVMYEQGKPLQIIRSDFRDVEMQKTLHYLTTETYINEPIYRLFNAKQASGGVFDMDILAKQSQLLSEPINLSLPHIIVDPSEEIGWRTAGWPEYQQETCILVPLIDGRLTAVSLFNFGLVQTEHVSDEKLRSIYPVLSAVIRRHFEWQVPVNERFTPAHDQFETSTNAQIDPNEVIEFFKNVFAVEITQREASIFGSLLLGNTIASIAEELFISIYTARTHRRNVYKKIGHGKLLELINQFHAYRNTHSQADLAPKNGHVNEAF